VGPASGKNICGICHETVNETTLENVINAPWHSLTSAAAFGTGRRASIAASIEMIDMLKNDIDELELQKWRQAANL
jgi:hypothetical protein